jgi:RNA polymerase sigma-70 factor (ECF subfamily)
MLEADKRSRYEAMFRSTYEGVLAYALRRTDRSSAEDVVAETYATAWRRFEIVPEDPLPWLYAVARRVLANSRRSGMRRIQLAARLAAELSPPAVHEPDPSEWLEDAAIMRAALSALSDSDAETLMLVAWEGLDHHRASIVLGVSANAFGVRLHRARRRLEAEVERLHSRPELEGRASGEER